MDTAIRSVARLSPGPEIAPALAELRAAWRHYASAGVRVAVLSPFNQGKSTLLNALLGSRALPVDIVSTTGGMIEVAYGTTPEARVTLVDGRTLTEPDFGLLRQFAVLDGLRRIREDVAAIELRLPHPLLERGVTLLDLPGTNDREEQDTRVRQTLLSADIVVHLLNARQLFTMGEQGNLREWLFGRGISEVVFVLNFLNLVEPEDREKVWLRAVDATRSLTGSDPPPLHRVDALPAFRACLTGDGDALEASGMDSFRRALEQRVEVLAANPHEYRGPRVRAAAARLALELEAIRNDLQTTLRRLQQERASRTRAREAARARDAQRVAVVVSRIHEQISGAALERALAAGLSTALEDGGFDVWCEWVRESYLKEKLRALNDLSRSPGRSGRPGAVGQFLPSTPGEPAVSLPPAPESDSPGDIGGVVAGVAIGAVMGSVVPVIGTLLGGVWGGMAGAAHAEARKTERKLAMARHQEETALACGRAAGRYLQALGSSIREELDAHGSHLMASLIPEPEPTSPRERELTARAEAVRRACAGLRSAAGEL